MVTVPGGPSRRTRPASPTTQVSACPIHCPTCSCGVRPTTTPSRCWRCSARRWAGGSDEPQRGVLRVEAPREPVRPLAGVGGGRAGGPRVVGFRTFMRWEFDGSAAGPFRAVRGRRHRDPPRLPGARGLLPAHAQHALDELRAEGVGFVFNTPNERSRPGYLKMGWQRGRPGADRGPTPRRLGPLGAPGTGAGRRPTSGRSRATPASPPPRCSPTAPARPRCSTPCRARSGSRPGGRPSSCAGGTGSPRCTTGPSRAGAALGDGAVVFRVRRRGPATEAAVCRRARSRR